VHDKNPQDIFDAWRPIKEICEAQGPNDWSISVLDLLQEAEEENFGIT